MDTEQKIEELSMQDPIVSKAMRRYYQYGDYEKCLELTVIALAEQVEALQKECLRLHMNAPVTMTFDSKDIERDAVAAKLGK